MDPFTALAGLSRGRKILAAVIGPLVLLAAGFAAGVGWEHRGPQTFPLSLAGKSLKAQRDEALADVIFHKGRSVYWYTAYDDWRRAHGRCEAARTQANQAAADGVNRAFAAGGTAESNAFNQGLAAGDRAGFRRGRATCGASDAPSSPARSPAGPGAGGQPAQPGRLQPSGEAGPDPVFGGEGAYRPSR